MTRRKKSPDMSGCPRCGSRWTKKSGLTVCSNDKCGYLLSYRANSGDRVSLGGEGYRRVPPEERSRPIEPNLHLDSPYRKAWRA